LYLFEAADYRIMTANFKLKMAANLWSDYENTIISYKL